MLSLVLACKFILSVFLISEMDRTHATDEGDALAEALTSHLKSTIAEEYPKLCEIWSELWDSAEKKLRKEMLQTHLTETVSIKQSN